MRPGNSREEVPHAAPPAEDLARELERARERLQGASGRQYWERLEALAEERDFQKLLQRLSPRIGWLPAGALDRRHFLKVMGASLALAGLGACTKQPAEPIVPYINQPPQIVQGKPLFFTSAMPLGGAAYGILVESNMGRPTKIEGNPNHPGSLGATDVFGQAAILSLYDPDRSQTVLQYGKVSSWQTFYFTLLQELTAKRPSGGAGLRLLTPPVISPTLERSIADFLARYPKALWHVYDPVGRENVRAGARLALGADAQPVYALEQAAVIVALDADFLMWEPGRLRHARDTTNGRRVREDRMMMNRLYALEGTLTLTGALADHRLAAAPSAVAGLARALARKVGVALPGGPPAAPAPEAERWLAAAAADLKRNPGAGVVIAGAGQPPEVHALAAAMNQELGNLGRTVRFIDPLEAGPPEPTHSLGALAEDMAAGRVEILLILGGNPVYDAPADLDFARRMDQVRLRIRHGLYEDETSLLCQWHLPETHFLESWGDVRGYDGTVSIQQPLIEPLYAGRSATEVLAIMLELPGASAYQMVRDTWARRLKVNNFDRAWQAALEAGTVAGTAAPARAARVEPAALARLAERPAPARPAGLEIIFRPDYAVWDGCFANNAWLQEAPRPMTAITWDNAALMGPATARRLGLADEDVVEMVYRGRKVKAPVYILNGHAEECVTVNLGYGRSYAGGVGTRVGFSAYALRTAQAPWFDGGLELRKTGQTHELARTRIHRAMHGRDLVRHATLEEFRRDPDMFHDTKPPRMRHDTVYKPYAYPAHAWGMMIDINTCIGCNACIVACQAENNIPTVGRRQVLRAREMHWLRVDPYFEMKENDLRVYFQPVPCMHCEQAPCEVVCPVAATAHSDEGLNEMVYNRCVGTRYCSNNCPYKVRHFNFLKYTDMETPVLKMGRNPEVTVRTRGVMEKCTYCVQRIVRARIAAKEAGRPIRDGEVMTACQAACPAGAIVFGDLNDPASQVARLWRQPQAYVLLAHLNTWPRTNYLARFTHPNPELERT